MGRLIKGEGRVVAAAVLTASEQAAQMLAAAQAEVSRARTEADGVRQEARRQGHADGYAAGRDAAISELLSTLIAARAHAESQRLSARETAAALALKMAERVIGRSVDLAPSVMQEIAAQALAASRAREGAIILRVHPDDLAPLREPPPLWADRARELNVQLVADAAVGRYGCVVETATGRLDARLDTQLATLERALKTGSPS